MRFAITCSPRACSGTHGSEHGPSVRCRCAAVADGCGSGRGHHLRGSGAPAMAPAGSGSALNCHPADAVSGKGARFAGRASAVLPEATCGNRKLPAESGTCINLSPEHQGGGFLWTEEASAASEPAARCVAGRNPESLPCPDQSRRSPIRRDPLPPRKVGWCREGCRDRPAP